MSMPTNFAERSTPEAVAALSEHLPENLSPLFLQASSEWQKVMKIVPGKHTRLLLLNLYLLTVISGGLSLTYPEAGCGHFQPL